MRAADSRDIKRGLEPEQEGLVGDDLLAEEVFEDVETLPRDLTDEFVLVVELASISHRLLIRCRLNLDGNTCSDLLLLDELRRHVVDLQTGAVGGAQLRLRRQTRPPYILPRGITVFFLVVGSVLTTQIGVPTRAVPSRMSHPTMMAAARSLSGRLTRCVGTLTVSSREGPQNLESDGENGRGRRVRPLGIQHLLLICDSRTTMDQLAPPTDSLGHHTGGESIEEVINNVG